MQCWGPGPGPKAGPMRQHGVDVVMGRGLDTELREKTDRHAEMLQSREAAFQTLLLLTRAQLPSIDTQPVTQASPHPDPI